MNVRSHDAGLQFRKGGRPSFAVLYSHPAFFLSALLLVPLFTSCSKPTLDPEVANAVGRHDLQRVRWAVVSYPDIASHRDTNGRTLLELAVNAGKSDMVELLLDNKADVNAKGALGKTALHNAVSDRRNHDLVNLLLSKGANINARDDYGCTPLHDATRSANKENVDLLLSAGADVNARDGRGDTPLHLAAAQWKSAIAEALVARGADINAKNNEGASPIGKAHLNSPVAKWLQEQAARNFVAEMERAVKSGDIDAARALLENDPSLVFQKNMPFLHEALSQHHPELAALLIEKGADINLKGGGYRQTALHLAIICKQNSSAMLLIKNGANVNAKDTEGKTPLHFISVETQKEVADLLLARGADVNAKDKSGSTPLHDVASSGSEAGVEWLLSNGADASVKNQKGYIPVLAAAENNHPELIPKFPPPVRSGADLSKWEGVATQGKDLEARREALVALSVFDQERLMQVAAQLPLASLRAFAVHKCTNEAFLLSRTRDDASPSVRVAALETLKSPVVIMRVAIDSYYSDLREIAATNSTLTSANRAEIDTAKKLKASKVAGLRSGLDSHALADTALTGGFDTLCLAVVNQLSDQELLAKVAIEAKDHELVKAALRKVFDTKALDQIAESARDSAARIAAAVQRGSTTWETVFSKATQIGDSKDLADSLAAVSLSRSSAIRGLVIDGCLSLIRRGDESRTSELSELLSDYGDAALCEDYLNSGQLDLYNAGSEWAHSHGGFIGTGAGSHRASWGMRQ